MKKVIFSILVCVYVAYAESLTFDKGLGLLLEKNYDALIQRYEIDKAKADTITASLRPNPVFSTNLTYLNYRNIRDYSNLQHAVSLSQEIETADKRFLRIKIARELEKYAELSYKASLSDLINTYTDAYTNLLTDKVNLENSKENMENYKKILNVAKIQYESGFLAELDYEKLKLNLVDYEKDYLLSLENFKKDVEYLKFLVGVDFSDVSIPQIQLPPNDLEDIIEKALTRRYDLKAYKLNIDITENQVNLNKAMAVPNITVGVEMDGYANKYSFIGFSISFQIPIFNKNNGEILKSRLNNLQAKLQAEKGIQQVKMELRQLYISLNSRYQIFLSYKEKFQNIQKLKNNTEKAFEYRGINVLALLDTLKLYRDFQRSYTQAMVDYINTYYKFKISTGDY